MIMKTIEERARDVLLECVGSHAKDKIVPEAHLYNDLAMDSLDVVELLMCLEDKFSIEITDEAWEGVMANGKVQDVYDYLKTVVKEK